MKRPLSPSLPAALLSVALLTCLLPKEDAWAQQTAAGFVEIATQRFADQDYEGAAGAFLSAYDLSPGQHVLLKNAVVAWFKADRCDMVVPLAKQYLVSQPELSRDKEEGLRLQVIQDRRDANKAIFKCQVKDIDALITQDDLPASKALLAETELHSAGGEDAQELSTLRERIKTREAALAPQPPVTGPVVQRGTQPPRKPSAGRTVGWVLVGIGGATLLAGGTYSIYTQVTYSGELPEGSLSEGTEAVESHNARAWVIYPVGVGLAAAGAVLLFLGDSDQGAMTWAPTILGPHSAGVSASMRF